MFCECQISGFTPLNASAISALNEHFVSKQRMTNKPGYKIMDR